MHSFSNGGPTLRIDEGVGLGYELTNEVKQDDESEELDLASV